MHCTHMTPGDKNLWCQSFDDLFDDPYDTDHRPCSEENQNQKHCTR